MRQCREEGGDALQPVREDKTVTLKLTPGRDRRKAWSGSWGLLEPPLPVGRVLELLRWVSIGFLAGNTSSRCGLHVNSDRSRRTEAFSCSQLTTQLPFAGIASRGANEQM